VTCQIQNSNQKKNAHQDPIQNAQQQQLHIKPNPDPSFRDQEVSLNKIVNHTNPNQKQKAKEKH
jgi:hypothetical protein